MKLIREGGLEEICGRNYRMAIFYCDLCGKNVKRIKKDGLKIKSCGCAIDKHGASGTKLYEVWKMMVRRCRDKKLPGYKYYGKRGIEVCDEWKEKFSNFRGWALSNGYKEGLQIDRINNDGNYEPSNCRFITATENIRNQSQVKLDWGDVKKIRELYSTGEYYQTSIAKIFGVTKEHISSIVKNKLWHDENYIHPTLEQIKRNKYATKLDRDKANKIRELYSTGKYFQKDIARMFGVTQTYISSIVKNKRWYDGKYKPVDKES